MSETLITAFEVVHYSPVRFDYPTATICTAIKNKETTLFRQCLGLPFYEDLLEDLIEYDNDIPVYDPMVEYDEGDEVLLDGSIFISLVNSNTESVEDNDAWELAPKFASEKYQYLWENYIRYYLAYMIIHSTINYSTFQAGSMGLVNIKNYSEQGQSTVDQKSMWNWKANIKQDAIDVLDNMKDYIRRHIDDYPNLNSFCGIRCTTRKKQRIAFRRSR